MTWVLSATIEERLKAEATATAARLGHKVGPWFRHDLELRAICVNAYCMEFIAVRVRTWRTAQLGGGALELRCIDPLTQSQKGKSP